MQGPALSTGPAPLSPICSRSFLKNDCVYVFRPYAQFDEQFFRCPGKIGVELIEQLISQCRQFRYALRILPLAVDGVENSFLLLLTKTRTYQRNEDSLGRP